MVSVKPPYTVKITPTTLTCGLDLVSQVTEHVARRVPQNLLSLIMLYQSSTAMPVSQLNIGVAK